MSEERWLLPEGIEEILPPDTWALEGLRRQLLDLYRSWGYELVMPPFIEFLESLLITNDHGLDLQTFKFTDQLSGRTLGIRADMTPQVARIDSHLLRQQALTRLCYLGTVLRTRTDGFGGSRSPLQVGVELYGHGSFESDAEVLSLMLETLQLSGLKQLHVDLGHVAIFRGLTTSFQLEKHQEAWLFERLQGKALPDMLVDAERWGLSIEAISTFQDLMSMHGTAEAVIARAMRQFQVYPEVSQALQDLQSLVAYLQSHYPELDVTVDLAELRGYHYHTGVVFSCYLDGYGQAVAQGGRYDEIGEVFGRARPATGFSADLRTLVKLGASVINDQPTAQGILAPWSNDPALAQCIAELRRGQERVIQALPGQALTPDQLGCDRQLVFQDGAWQMIPVT